MDQMSSMRVQRFFKGFTLDDLRLKTGIDQGKLSRIERGYLEAKEGEKRAIAKGLKCRVEEIFGGGKNVEIFKKNDQEKPD